MFKWIVTTATATLLSSSLLAETRNVAAEGCAFYVDSVRVSQQSRYGFNSKNYLIKFAAPENAVAVGVNTLSARTQLDTEETTFVEKTYEATPYTIDNGVYFDRSVSVPVS